MRTKNINYPPLVISVFLLFTLLPLLLLFLLLFLRELPFLAMLVQ